MNFSIDGLQLERDPLSRSEAYYCRNAAAAVIDGRVIDALKARLETTGGSLIRICLHSGPDDAMHEMVIVQRRGLDFKPHKHQTKDESYHMLEGRLRVDFYDDSGRRTRSLTLGSPGSGLPSLLRVRCGVWHSTHPETDFIAVHESRPGPFIMNDSIAHTWDPRP
ncbi:MAG: WbuC family cupin fold metalloprotein [Elusimicrobiota bacterium]